MNLHQFFSNLYKPLRLLGRSSRTVVLYEYSIKLFGRSLGREPVLEDLNDIEVANHLQTLLDEGRSPHGVRKERSQLLAIWNFAARKRYVHNFPEVPPIVAPMQTPKAWTRGELESLFSACRCEGGAIGGVPARRWWYAIHCVLWDTGERIGAILQLSWADLDDDWLTIRAEYRKGRRVDRVVKLHPMTVEAIRLLSQKNDLIFPWPYSDTYLYRVYNRILRRAGLPTDSKSKFHRMRRSFASHLHAAGADATAACGHSSDEVTRKSYLDPRIATSAQPADILFRAG